MWLLSIVFLVLSTSLTDGARILAIFMTPSFSHQIVYQPIWKELSLRGHEVTVYTPSPLNDPTLTNLTEYDLSFTFEIMKNADEAAYDIQAWLKRYEEIGDAQLSHPYMQNLINRADNDTYDLLLVEYLWPAMYAFKELYDIPMVGISSLPATIGSLDCLGLDKHPVLDPDMMLPFSTTTSFKQRFFSWAYQWLYRYALKGTIGVTVENQMNKYFNTVTKPWMQLLREVNLIIANYNIVSQNVKPLVPKFVPISAIHVKPQKLLPRDLARILDNLDHDVIYFSLGSNVKSSKVSPERMGKILSVLGKLPYTILWKYETENLPSELPKNFIVRQWFPQQDILGHPKVKLFITQAGLQSMDEAISRAVPMLAIPFLGDQLANSDKIVNLGIGEMLDFHHFTENDLNDKLSRLLTDSKYQKNVDKMQKIIKDQPMSSLDTAVFWIEYVLRHDGAHHLEYAGANLPFYQYYMLDVYAVLLFSIALIVYVVLKVKFLPTFFRTQIKMKVL